MKLLAKPSCRGLQLLDLSGNSLGVSGLQALEYIVTDSCLTNLGSLFMRGCLLDNTALETFLKSLSVHCRHLYSLYLSDNNLGVHGVSALAITISQCKNTIPSPYRFEGESWLSSIELNNTKLGDKGLRAFVENLGSPYIFANLSLQKNDIHASGITFFADWLENVYSEWADDGLYIDGDSLSLKDNPLGIEGVIAIGKILGCCKQSHVKLSRCHLTDNTSESVHGTFQEVGYQLSQMSTSCVSCLYLNGNCFSGEHIHILAGLMCLCRSLSCLYCRRCNITSHDLIQLLESIAKYKISDPDVCSELCVWHLDENEIDNRGVSALMFHIELFPKLGSEQKLCAFNLNGNPVTREMIEKLNSKYLVKQ